MKKSLILIIALISALSLPTGAQNQAIKETSAAAKLYLEAALDLMQANFVRKNSVDWNALRQRAMKAAAGAEEPVDTYEAIRLALRDLRDNRSVLEISRELRDREASRKPNRNDPSRFMPPRAAPPADVQRGPEGYLHKVGGASVARVVVPVFAAPTETSSTELRVTQLQKAIEDLDAAKPCGWLIDLRGNTSNDLWSTLAGIGPLLGDGIVGGFRDADGNLVKWYYREGKSGIRDLVGAEHELARVGGQAYHLKRLTPIAVLIDRKTANSSQAIAVTLRGAPMTRFFGEPVSITSSTEKFALSDGAIIILTVGVYVDRSGAEYPEGVAADEAIQSGIKIPRAGEDPVIHAALGWVAEQGQCSEK